MMKKIIAKLSIENEEISHFQTHFYKTKLKIISVTNVNVLRQHSMEFNIELSETDLKEDPTLIDLNELNIMKLVKFKTTSIQMDPYGKFVVLIDSSGQLKIILTSNFKTVREGKVGFGPIKTRLFKDYVLSLSKDRVLSIFDVKKNKKHRTIDLTKYSGIDTQYYEFIILDDKMR
jgi:hypothetical protein